MGDENPIRTLGDYSKPSHEGYRNTIELPVGNNVVPLRSDIIWLVQNGCLFPGSSVEDPNQHTQGFLKCEETDHIFGLADETKSYPVGIVKDVEVHIGKLKLLNYFYVIDMKKDPETPLLVERGFLATANVVIDYRLAKIAMEEGITRLVFRVKGEIARDVELNTVKDTLVFKKMVEFLGAIPINLKSNMWESEDLIKKPINWDKPPKNRDGAWHAKIRLIDPDGEEFTKTLQSIPTTRKLFEKESPREIIDLDHVYDT
ncbi:hypothetical protein Tco_1088479 [Tanacetum coccineum]